MATFAERVIVALEAMNKQQIQKVDLEPFLREALDMVNTPLAYSSYDHSDASISKLQDYVMINLLISLCNIPYVVGRPEVAHFRSLILPPKKDPTAEARLFAALHLAKTSVPNSWELLTLELVDSGEVAGVNLQQLKEWAIKLIFHPRGWKLLLQMVKYSNSQLNPPVIDISPNNLVSKVQFFTCQDVGLWAFSGVGTLFLNLSAFAHVHEEYTRKDFDFLSDFSKIAPLLAATVGYHEIVYMAVLKTADNVNTTGVEGNLKQRYGYYYSVNPGLIAQIRLFGLGGIPEWFYLKDSHAQDFLEYIKNGTRKVMPPSKTNLIPSTRPPLFPNIYKLNANINHRCLISGY